MVNNDNCVVVFADVEKSAFRKRAKLLQKTLPGDGRYERRLWLTGTGPWKGGVRVRVTRRCDAAHICERAQRFSISVSRRFAGFLAGRISWESKGVLE